MYYLLNSIILFELINQLFHIKFLFQKELNNLLIAQLKFAANYGISEYFNSEILTHTHTHTHTHTIL